MYQYNRKLNPLIVALSIILFSSCERLVSVDPPPDQLPSDVIFKNDKTATAAIMGLYAGMIQPNLSFASCAMTLYPGMSADEIENPIAGPYDIFSKNALTAGEPRISNLWSSIYKYIYQANAIVEGLSNSNSVSDRTKSRLIGEALFIRAFCHFYLVNLFGDAPLITSTSYQTNAATPRTSRNKVYAQIITDLNEAKKLLAGSPVETTRPSTWAATALLSRVYLFHGDFKGAEAAASAVIESGVYRISNNLDEVFSSKSPGAIWQLVPVAPGHNTWEGNIFIPTSGNIPFMTITSFLLNAFEPDDKRWTAWTGVTMVNGKTYRYPYKYKVRVGSQVTEYYMVLRLAELYLIRAEARARQSKLTGPNSAKSDINIIRARAGLNNTNASEKEELMKAIEQERRIEFFAEWGHRWFDLKRTGKANQILGSQKGERWQSTDMLYPIPSIEIEKNSLFTQNDGY